MVIDSRALEMCPAETGTVKETLQKPYLLEGYCFSIQCTDSPDIARVCVSFPPHRKCSSQSALAVEELTCRKKGFCDECPFLGSPQHHLGFKAMAIFFFCLDPQ